MKKTALEKIAAYLRKRKTGATAHEIALYAKVNYHTVRRELSVMSLWLHKEATKKCRITGKQLMSYKLAV